MIVSSRKAILLGLSIVAIVLVIHFQFNKNKDQISTLDPSMVEKLELMRGQLVGTKLNITKIIPASKFESDSSKLVVYYHSFDCTHCVNKLMGIVTEIKSLFPALSIYSISDKLENSEMLKKHSIEIPFFVDEAGQFPKWTYNSYSPVILYLDEDKTIREVYHATTPVFEKGRSRFFKFLDKSVYAGL